MTVGDKGEPKKEEFLKKIVSDYEKREKEKESTLERKLKRGHGENSFKSSSAVVALVVMALLMLRITIIIAAHSGVFSEPRYWAGGRHAEYDKNTEECIGRMWQIRKAVDRHYNVNKRFPGSIEELGKSGLLSEKDLACPATGRKYLIEVKEGVEVFACPNPGTHGFSDLRCRLKGGAPEIVGRQE
jgi:hypothetical protein